LLLVSSSIATFLISSRSATFLSTAARLIRGRTTGLVRILLSSYHPFLFLLAFSYLRPRCTALSYHGLRHLLASSIQAVF